MTRSSRQRAQSTHKRPRTPSPPTGSAHSLPPTSPLSPISPWPPPIQLPRSVSTNTGSHVGQSHTKRQDDTLENETLPSAKEVYGSIAVLGTYLTFGLYLIWAFAPLGSLDKVGWTWYPEREWAVIVPCYMMLLVLLAYFVYAGLTAFLTPPFDSPTAVTDRHSCIPLRNPNEEPYYHKFADPKAIPVAMDLPIDFVNRVLYPPRARPGVK